MNMYLQFAIGISLKLEWHTLTCSQFKFHNQTTQYRLKRTSYFKILLAYAVQPEILALQNKYNVISFNQFKHKQTHYKKLHLAIM